MSERKQGLHDSAKPANFERPRVMSVASGAPVLTTTEPDVLLIDNYDSFTYNLFQYMCELGASVVVRRNDKITVDECAALKRGSSVAARATIFTTTNLCHVINLVR